MGSTTITATQLIDVDGSPLNGTLILDYSTTLAVTDGACSGTVPSGTYTSIGLINTYAEVANLGVQNFADGATVDVDAICNGAWALQCGSVWKPLLFNQGSFTSDLVVASGAFVLPLAPVLNQVLTIINSGTSTTVSSSVAIGNGATPTTTSLDVPALASVTLRFDGSFWRILGLYTAGQ